MTNESYLRLREQLDQYSLGFPATESGVELKILERLFTEEEAEMFLHMSLISEIPKGVAQRVGRDQAKVAALLEQMAQKGLVFRLRKDDKLEYAAAPFVAGIYEFQLGTIDRELAELFEQYFNESFDEAVAKGAAFLRPIPVKRSVDTALLVATYDDSRELVKKQQLIAVADCICRVQQGLLGRGCGKPLHVCLAFGSFAQHFIDMNSAKKITVEEALGILDRAEKAGLVSQPAGSQNPAAICNCCGDCCAVLRALNKHPYPAKLVISNYYAVVEETLCTGCENCLERCQMGAITIEKHDVAEIDQVRCIGCGLCVTTCPENALTLVRKPMDHRCVVPEKASQLMREMSEKRGKSLVPLAWSE